MASWDCVSKRWYHLKGFIPNTVMAENYTNTQLPGHNPAVFRLLPRVDTCVSACSPFPRALAWFDEFLGSKVTQHLFFRGQAWHDFLSYSIKATIETGHRHLSLLRVGSCSCILSSCSNAGMETFTVTLEGGSPWGFSIQGGVDHRSPLRVGKVCTPVNRHSIDQVSAAWDEKPRSTILKSLVEASMVEEMSMKCYCYKCPNMWCLVLIVSELVWKGKLRPVHTCISKILSYFRNCSS